MEKLELHDIAPYLPYELKLFCDRNSKIYNVFGYVKDSLLTSQLQKPSVDEMFHTAIFAMKPILYPLSDLSKEIQHKGKTIVPIIEILKRVSLFDLSLCGFRSTTEESEFFGEAFEKGRCVDSIYFNGNIFEVMNNDGSLGVLSPQHEAIEILNEFHFDWKYNLIAKGLAIDINNLKS